MRTSQLEGELSMTRILVLVLPLFVGGCFLPVNMTIASLVVNGLSLAATGKGTADHALSAISNQDCNMLRVAKSEAICRANETVSTRLVSENEGVLRAGTKPDAASKWDHSHWDHPRSAVPTALAGATPR